jgi:hypothetical protein
MSLSTIADLAEDEGFKRRVMVAVVTNNIDSNPEAWINENILKVASSEGFEDAYASALAQEYLAQPGKNPAVISDDQIIAAVKAIAETLESNVVGAE